LWGSAVTLFVTETLMSSPGGSSQPMISFIISALTCQDILDSPGGGGSTASLPSRRKNVVVAVTAPAGRNADCKCTRGKGSSNQFLA
jgi:hypothetical protein